MSDIDLIDPERIRPELERTFARRGFMRAAGTATLSATAVGLIVGCESVAKYQTAAAGGAGAPAGAAAADRGGAVTCPRAARPGDRGPRAAEAGRRPPYRNRPCTG